MPVFVYRHLIHKSWCFLKKKYLNTEKFTKFANKYNAHTITKFEIEKKKEQGKKKTKNKY